MEKIGILILNKEYNDFLPGLFKSLETQTMADFKVLLCDYGSAISPEPLLSNYNFKSQFFQFIPPKDGNDLQHARNFMAKQTDTEYICYPDADCILEPYFLEVLLKVHSENIAYTYGDFWYMRDGAKRLCEVPEFDKDDIKGWQISILLKRKYFVPFDIFFKKLQDWDWQLAIYKQFKGIGKKVNSKPLFTHIQEKGRSISWKRINEHNYWKRRLKEKYPELTKNWK